VPSAPSRTRSDDFIVPDNAALTMMVHGDDEEEHAG
jgi:hypothetical protein